CVVNDAAGEIAADGQLTLARSVNRQIVRDAEFTGKSDDAAQSRGEVDDIRPGSYVSVKDRLTERTNATVVQVQDCESTRSGPILQGFDGEASAAGHGKFSSHGSVCGTMRETPFGAQTERRGGAGPAGGLLSGKDPAGRFFTDS